MKLEFGKITGYTINIVPSDNKGFIVKVGCCTAVFNTIPDMLDAIEELLTHPEQTEKAYNEAMKKYHPTVAEPTQPRTGLFGLPDPGCSGTITSGLNCPD